MRVAAAVLGFAALVHSALLTQPDTQRDIKMDPTTSVRLVVSRDGSPPPIPLNEYIAPPAERVWPTQLSSEELTSVLLAAGWPEHLLTEASRVAWCESRWAPGIIGDHGASFGLFQIQPKWHARRLLRYGYRDAPELLLDPVINATIALDILRDSGWGPWTCKRVL